MDKNDLIFFRNISVYMICSLFIATVLSLCISLSLGMISCMLLGAVPRINDNYGVVSVNS